jgi:hypothetical protein
MSDRKKSSKPSFDVWLIQAFIFSLWFQGALIIDGQQKIVVVAVELVIGISLSLWHRHQNQWKWQPKWPEVKFSWLGIVKGIGGWLQSLTFIFLFLVYGRTAVFKEKASFEDWHDLINPDKIGGILTREWQAIVNAFWHNPEFNGMVLGLIIVMSVGLLVSIGLVELTHEDFLQKCQAPENGKPIGGLLRKFIHDRPLTIDKPPDAIRLEFPLSPPQELEDSLVIVLLVFVIFFAFGFSRVGYVLVTDLGPRMLTGFEMTGEWAIQIYSLIFGSLLVTVGPWVIWQWGFRNLFVRRVMEFKPDRLIISDRLWGRDRPKIEIPKMDLQPLRESNGQTTFPGNKLFWLQHRGKDVMLARFLLSTGMASIQTTYDRYRTTNFAEFYRDTESLNRPLD